MNGYSQRKNGNDGTISGFLRSQGELEAGALKTLTITASGFIKNDKVRYDFVTNIEEFTKAQLNCISGNGSQGEKTLTLNYLQQEQEYLEKQVICCNQNRYSQQRLLKLEL